MQSLSLRSLFIKNDLLFLRKAKHNEEQSAQNSGQNVRICLGKNAIHILNLKKNIKMTYAGANWASASSTARGLRLSQCKSSTDCVQ